MSDFTTKESCEMFASVHGGKIVIAILLAILIFVSPAHAGEFLGADVGIFVSAESTSHDQEALQLGLQLEWKHVVIEGSHGTKKVYWSVPSETTWEQGEWQSGSTIAIRVYPFNTETIRPLFIWRHSSDLMRGRPFAPEEEEPTADFLGLGATFDFNRFEIDLAYGVAGRECRGFSCGSNAKTSEYQIRIRGFLFGGKK